jgi:hypothetical protein
VEGQKSTEVELGGLEELDLADVDLKITLLAIELPKVGQWNGRTFCRG